MSGRHEASRRRSYGPRRHERRERSRELPRLEARLDEAALEIQAPEPPAATGRSALAGLADLHLALPLLVPTPGSVR